jgi:hypothetical protein
VCVNSKDFAGQVLTATDSSKRKATSLRQLQHARLLQSLPTATAELAMSNTKFSRAKLIVTTLIQLELRHWPQLVAPRWKLRSARGSFQRLQATAAWPPCKAKSGESKCNKSISPWMVEPDSRLGRPRTDGQQPADDVGGGAIQRQLGAAGCRLPQDAPHVKAAAVADNEAGSEGGSVGSVQWLTSYAVSRVMTLDRYIWRKMRRVARCVTGTCVDGHKVG